MPGATCTALALLHGLHAGLRCRRYQPPPAPAGGTALPLTLTLKKPDGEKVSTQIVRACMPAARPTQHAIQLPGDAPTGRWLLEARIDPAAKRPDAAWGFQVEESFARAQKLDLQALKPRPGSDPLHTR